MDHLNPHNRQDKMCRSKRPYSSIEEMRQQVGAWRKAGLRMAPMLYAYTCPYCGNFHLTKHSRPIDPELHDRVNVALTELADPPATNGKE
jgi:hypothetical protein